MKLATRVAAACAAGVMAGAGGTAAQLPAGARSTSVDSDTLRYDVFFGEAVRGFVRWWRQPDGTLNLVDELHDRGRGARSRWQIRFDASGTAPEVAMTDLPPAEYEAQSYRSQQTAALALSSPRLQQSRAGSACRIRSSAGQMSSSPGAS